MPAELGPTSGHFDLPPENPWGVVRHGCAVILPSRLCFQPDPTFPLILAEAVPSFRRNRRHVGRGCLTLRRAGPYLGRKRSNLGRAATKLAESLHGAQPVLGRTGPGCGHDRPSVVGRAQMLVETAFGLVAPSGPNSSFVEPAPTAVESSPKLANPKPPQSGHVHESRPNLVGVGPGQLWTMSDIHESRPTLSSETR